MTKNSLEKLRTELGKKDLEILALLNERARLSMKVGRLKNRSGEAIFDPSQEARVFARLREANDGPLPFPAVRQIFREIISSSRSLQAVIKVAYLGPEASFSHQATLAHFGHGMILTPEKSIAEVFAEVEKGEVSLGVVPVENSIEGSVRQTLDRLAITRLRIRSEIHLRVSLCLVSVSREKDRIKRIYSHPHAFAECREWLNVHLPGCLRQETESTAAAARIAMEDGESAAIAGALAARHYGMEILAQGIEDRSRNITRFLVVGEGESEPTGDDKTSIVFSLRNAAGALVGILTPLALAKINILAMESRPIHGRPWEYLFFVDFDGHREEEPVSSPLREMEGLASSFRILGSYPKGDPA